MTSVKELPPHPGLFTDRQSCDPPQRRAEECPGTFAASPAVSDLLTSSSSPPPFAAPPASGSSSPAPPQQQPQSDDDARILLGPQRPKSTPFPYAPSDRARADARVLSAEESSLPTPESDVDYPLPDPSLQDVPYRAPPARSFGDLPTEIQEAILDHIFGFRVSRTSMSRMPISSIGSQSWSTALRHSRRRELTELALVSPTWRELVQRRLYRHVKLKGTADFLNDAMMHFALHEHLRPMVRHVEIWYPVFQPTYAATPSPTGLVLPTVTTDGLTNTTYTLPRNKCTLDETFRFISATLPGVQVLTLEGGHRRKAPQVVHFHDGEPDPAVWRELASLPSVKTLITRGQWNLARTNRDFLTLLRALPSLEQWHGSYSKAKSKAYITMSEFLPLLPRQISVFKLSLEADYRHEPVMPPFFTKAAGKTHTCSSLGSAAVSLEHFSYTGRCCHTLFDRLARLADPRNTRLQSIDLTVKNCCRPLTALYDSGSGSGIQDMGFIEAFEKLVLAAIRALEVLKKVRYLRIRFVDLGRFFFSALVISFPVIIPPC